jgi:excisionase family DNA binding protein
MEKYLNAKELAESLSMSSGTIYYLCHLDQIPHYKIGRLVRFKESEIVEWLSKKKRKGRANTIPEMDLEKGKIRKKA